MILDVDIGNSRVKWRIRGAADTRPDAGIFDTALLLEARGPCWPLSLPPFRRVCVSSVRSPADNQQITRALTSRFAVCPEFAHSQQLCAGVTSGYQSPATLGVDRWLALLAAHAQFAGDLLVVDAGTALTVDLLSAGGLHLGGYILPGVNSMINGLTQNTAAVRVDMAQIDVTLQPGRTTRACVSAAVSAAVRGVLAAAAGQMSQPVTLVLCGGDSGWLTQVCLDLPYHIQLAPHLVLDGLALNLPGQTDYF